MASPTIANIARICAVLILIIAVYSFILSIKEKASAVERPTIMVSLQSLERFLNYPCEPGTEDYRYEGYIMCERRHDFVPGKPRFEITPYPPGKNPNKRTDI